MPELEEPPSDADAEPDAEPVFTPRVLIPRELVKGSMRTSMEVRFRIRPDGSCTVELISGTGEPAIDRLALETLATWRWRPRQEGGRRVASEVEMSVDFVVSEPSS